MKVSEFYDGQLVRHKGGVPFLKTGQVVKIFVGMNGFLYQTNCGFSSMLPGYEHCFEVIKS